MIRQEDFLIEEKNLKRILKGFLESHIKTMVEFTNKGYLPDRSIRIISTTINVHSLIKLQ